MIRNEQFSGQPLYGLHWFVNFGMQLALRMLMAVGDAEVSQFHASGFDMNRSNPRL